LPAEQRTIKLHPVYGNGDPNHENTKFWNATPSGQFHFTMISLETAEQFELNKEYYVHYAGGLNSSHRASSGRMADSVRPVEPASMSLLAGPYHLSPQRKKPALPSVTVGLAFASIVRAWASLGLRRRRRIWEGGAHEGDRHRGIRGLFPRGCLRGL